MENFVAFFLVIFSGIFFSSVFRRLHLPWVVTLIIGGIIIGPHGLDFFHLTPSIDFIGEIGLIFLMFMAGLEVNAGQVSVLNKKLLVITLLNGAIPFLVGIGISWLLGLSFVTSILIGIVFVSSSIAIVIPMLEDKKLFGRNIGRYTVMATIILDIVSLILLSVVFQTVSPTRNLPLHIYYIIVPVFIIGIWYASPLINLLFPKDKSQRDYSFQQDLRVAIVLLLGIVIAFEFLGLHPIVGGFFAGLLLSNVFEHDLLADKLKAIGYAVFIPVFFIIVGSQTNIQLLFNSWSIWYLAGFIVVGSILAKYLSGFIGARLAGFTPAESSFIGSATVPQLSTTLAVTYSAQTLGIFSEQIVVSMVLLSVITTFFAPIAMSISLQYIPGLPEEAK